MKRLADRPALLRDGREAYPAMLSDIASARRFVLLETYILAGDRTGRRFARALAERARNGVEVSLLYDGVGSMDGVDEGFLAGLSASGVRHLAYRPLRATLHPSTLRMLGKRDHRKQLVVDGRVGHLGGINVHDPAAPRAQGGQGWRDTQLRIAGPAVAEMVRLFAHTWRAQKGPALHPDVQALEQAARVLRPAGWRRVWRGLRRRLRRVRRGAAGAWLPMAHGHIEVVGNTTHSERSRIRRAYLDAIRRSRRSVYVTNSYFVPDLRLLAALRAAARRGVDVRVLVPGASDVRAVMHAARALYGRLLSAGVRIFEMSGRVLHAKTAVVDGSFCTIGSFNLDHRSWRYNLEANAIVVDPVLGTAMERLFREDLLASAAVLPEAWRRRPLSARALQFLFWLVRYWL